MGETLGVVIALIAAFGSSAAAAITAWRMAPAGNFKKLAERVEILEGQLTSRDEKIDGLGEWQLAARAYIFTLSNKLADAGFDVPEPPEALHIEHRKPH